MATAGFELLFQNLQNVGFFEIGLPVIFFMAVFYGLLEKTGVLSDDEAVNGTAAIALALLTTLGILTVIPFSFFPQFFAALSVLVVLVLGVLLLMGMAGLDVSEGLGEDQQKYAVIGVVILLILLGPPLLQQTALSVEIGERYTNFLVTLATLFALAYIVKSFGD